MQSCTDAFGRIITPINSQSNDPKIMLAAPTFDTDADGLINVMEDGGINWYVMNPGSALPLFLAFEFSATVTLDALDAAQRLKRRFDHDTELRQAMTGYALSVGSAFHGFGTTGTVWDTPPDHPTAA
jgi:hypothetical protein